MNPRNGIDYNTAKQDIATAKATRPDPLPPEELLALTLTELNGYNGSDDGRIILSINAELLDVSTGRDIYGPGCGYSLFAGHDVTRCLGTMSLDPQFLDDLKWEPDCAEEEAMVKQWAEKLKEKYPVAGRMKTPAFTIVSPEGLRKRGQVGNPTTTVPTETAPIATEGKNDDATQKCPISGKEGMGCPMSAMGLLPPKPKSKPAPKKVNQSGFMGGKSLVASVQKESSSGESFFWKLCPVHWDGQTFKLLAMVACFSWLVGIAIGWKLRAAIME